VRADVRRPLARQEEHVRVIGEWFLKYTPDVFADRVISDALTENI
jgi:hypothetical protein